MLIVPTLIHPPTGFCGTMPIKVGLAVRNRFWCCSRFWCCRRTCCHRWRNRRCWYTTWKNWSTILADGAAAIGGVGTGGGGIPLGKAEAQLANIACCASQYSATALALDGGVAISSITISSISSSFTSSISSFIFSSSSCREEQCFQK